jgi:hypothetical protein
MTSTVWKTDQVDRIAPADSTSETTSAQAWPQARRTTVTELVNRHQLKPVIQTGAIVMDQLFG